MDFKFKKLNAKNIYSAVGYAIYQYNWYYMDNLRLLIKDNKVILHNSNINVDITGINNIIKYFKINDLSIDFNI